MKIFAIYCFVFFTTFSISAQPMDPVQFVNPFIGTKGGGNTFPGAVLPFSSVSLSPDTRPPQSTSGYVSGQPTIGFSHTHTSGTGGKGRYGHFLVFPQNGKYNQKEEVAEFVSEKASPAYYNAILDNGVIAELTLSEHVGFHKYQFEEESFTVVIDLTSGRHKKTLDFICTDIEFEKQSDYKIAGSGSFKGGWGGQNPHRAYFVAEFDTPIEDFGLISNKKPLTKQNTFQKSADTVQLKSWFTFENSAKQVKMKLVFSHKSYENANKFMQEIPEWDFDQVRKKGEDQWRDYLSKIEIKGGSEADKFKFYTGLYHSVILPRDLSDDNPLWRSDKPHYWDYYCIWDTFRSANPLMMLINPQRQGALIASLLDIYQHKGWLPDAWIAGDYGVLQGGSNADVVLSEAIQKNIPGFDYQLAYEAIRKNAEVDAYQGPILSPKYGRYLNRYLKHGYLPSNGLNIYDKPGCPVSRSLEYAYNDFTIALAAKKLGKDKDYQKYLQRSDLAFNLFNVDTRFFWAKDDQGNWLDGFDPEMHKTPWVGPFYEGSPWHYSMSAPHNVKKLIELHGGKEKIIEFLDTMFDEGHYTQHNQPDIHVPWMYHYAGRPDKSTQRVHHILKSDYENTPDGLPGNDDAGTMSAWYVLGSIGLYPVPGQDLYLITTPYFDEVSLKTGHGELKISKSGESNNLSIKNITLNGKKLNRSWLRHHEIVNGGNLIIEMGAPDKEFINNLPPSYDEI